MRDFYNGEPVFYNLDGIDTVVFIVNAYRGSLHTDITVYTPDRRWLVVDKNDCKRILKDLDSFEEETLNNGADK
jgi:hypothetical protein